MTISDFDFMASQNHYGLCITFRDALILARHESQEALKKELRAIVELSYDVAEMQLAESKKRKAPPC